MEVRPSSGPRLPLRDESIDIVLCIEAFGSLRSTDRRELLRESHRILRAQGIFCAWIEQREAEAFGRTLVGSSQIDFWALEDQINAIFPRVDMLAQMPWQGFSLAPILDDEAAYEAAYAGGDAVAGADAYAKACAVCHDSGLQVGSTAAYPKMTLAAYTVGRIAQKVRTSGPPPSGANDMADSTPGPMPFFEAKDLSATDLADIIAHIKG